MTTTDPVAPPAGLPEFESLPMVTRVEADPFCPQCGQGLHGQAIRQDPRTLVYLVRCSRCGRFEPAAAMAAATRLWLGRATTVLVGFWMLLLLGAMALVGLIEGALIFDTAWSLSHFLGYADDRWTGNVSTSEPRPLTSVPWSELQGFMLPLILVLLILGFVGGMAATVVFPHWRRWGYYVFALGWPAIVSGFVLLAWYIDPGDMPLWGCVVCVAVYAGARFCGAVLGTVAGRPLARAMATLLLPRRIRAAMGYLWTADGRPTPTSVS